MLHLSIIPGNHPLTTILTIIHKLHKLINGKTKTLKTRLLSFSIVAMQLLNLNNLLTLTAITIAIHIRQEK